MDLRVSNPPLYRFCPEWPIHNYSKPLPPAKFVHNKTEEEGRDRVGRASDSIICDGCIISGSTVVDSILSPEVRVHSYSIVENSILMNKVELMEGCKIRNAIIDRHVHLDAGTEIGYNREVDAKRFKVVDLDKEEGTWLTIIEKNHDLSIGIMQATNLNV